MNFTMNNNRYNYIIQNVIFNEPRKEREIFDLLVKGYNAGEISIQVGMCERTVYRRKKALKSKILSLF